MPTITIAGMSAGARKTFWARTKLLTAWLLVLWLLLSLAVPWWARELEGLHFFGFPLGHWLAAQGMLLMYLALIIVYVLAMDRLEAHYLQATEADTDRNAAAAAAGE